MRKSKGSLVRLAMAGFLAAALVSCSGPFSGEELSPSAESRAAVVRVNVILDGPLTDTRLAALGRFGAVKDGIVELNSFVVQGKGLTPAALLGLPFVTAANFDAERSAGPVAPMAADSMVDGRSTWDLDAVDVTDPAAGGRTVAQDGAGV